MGKKKTKVKAKIKQKQKTTKKAKNIVKKQAQQQIPKIPAYIVALAQINPLVGDINSNVQKIAAAIDKAKQSGAQLVIFPELTITGHPPKDLLLRPDFIDKNMQKFIEVVNATKGISCIFGFVNKVNQNIYNAVAYVKDQKILAIYNKAHLLQKERKYFVEGAFSDIVIENKRVGIVFGKDELAIQQYVAKGVDFIAIVDASAYTINKQAEQQIISLAKKYSTPLVYCNQAGAQAGAIFDGASCAVDKSGIVIGRARKFSEDILLCDITKQGTLFSPLPNQLDDVYAALTLGIRDYFAKTGHQKALIAISGGMDSAVTAALAVHALGKENVTGLFLPSKITSKESVQDAKRICSSLGIEYKTINIDSYSTLFAKAAGLKYEKKSISFVEQNIQARVRANLLMIYANKNNLLLLSSLNKTDLATGYFTMHGEATGAFLPLGDLWKSDVVRLAMHMNKQKKIIPESVLKKQPSNELRYDQKDSDDLPPYEVLDKILELYVVEKKDIFEISKMGFDQELVRRIACMIMKNEFKRRQVPFSLAVTSVNFNSFKLPVINGWKG
jgi:NAD+ synthase (glutamine-hydrolysing)